MAAAPGRAPLTLLALWTLGSRVLRMIGGLLILAALAGLALRESLFASALLLLPGLSMWMTGHLLYAYRHHTYATPLAERVLRTLCTVTRQPDPTRR